MHGALTFAEAFRGIVSNISMALLLGLIAIAVIAWMVKTMATPMRKLLGGGIVRVALASAMVWTGIVESFSKHTNDPPRSVALPLLSITPEDISNGWRMVETREGCAFSRAHDATCAIHEPWLVRGGFGDVVRISANGWFFPWRDGFADELIVFSDGEIRPNLRTSFFPRPFDVPLAVVPAFNWHQLLGCASNVFWHVSTPSNSIVVAWENAPVNRDANILTNFQAEFFADGRFAYRYDDRMVDYSPVFPFDWDNDGLENSVDPEPLVAGPDAHGTNAEWYNTVCSNIVNSNAYYFVDVVAERGPSPIRFTGDRACRLGDPAIVALAGETNRVPLLIGIDYAVTSDTPFTVSFPVDYTYVEVETNEPCVARIRWPLDFEFTESIGPSNRTYAVTVVPYDPGGEFSWGDGGGVLMRGGTSGGGCSCVSYDGHGVVFGCTAQCPCAGTCLAVGTYSLENASFPFSGGECRCVFDDPEEPEGPPSSHDPNDGPSFTISFSKSAVIFEDAYEDRPGYLKPKRSSRVRLTVDAYGGTHGGTVDLTSVNLHKLSPLAGGQINLPASFGLDAHGTFYATCVYEGTEASTSAGDVSVSGVFTEADTGLYVSSSNSITVVKVELRTHVTAPGNASRSRHAYGVCEKVALLTSPLEVNVEWNCNRGVSAFVVAPGDGTKSYVCPTTNDVPDNLHLLYGGAEYVPLISIVEPSGFHIRDVTYMDMNCPSGIVGGLEMRLPMFVLPTSVSFSNVYIQEVPCYDEIPPVGYFTNAVNKSHTIAAGAGNWGQPALSGYWMTDKVGRLPVTNGWSAGTMVWKIPIGWNAAPASPVAKEINPDQYRQRFEIFSNGTLRIDKHENWISRTIDDHIFLNGEQMK